MTHEDGDARKLLQELVRAYNGACVNIADIGREAYERCERRLESALDAAENYLNAPAQAEPRDVSCKDDPRAPHGYLRNASHEAGRYVCECEFWHPSKDQSDRGAMDSASGFYPEGEGSIPSGRASLAATPMAARKSPVRISTGEATRAVGSAAAPAAQDGRDLDASRSEVHRLAQEWVLAWERSQDPTIAGSTCRLIRAESAVMDYFMPPDQQAGQPAPFTLTPQWELRNLASQMRARVAFDAEHREYAATLLIFVAGQIEELAALRARAERAEADAERLAANAIHEYRQMQSELYSQHHLFSRQALDELAFAMQKTYRDSRNQERIAIDRARTQEPPK